MPITAPKSQAAPTGRNSDFIICQGLVFKPRKIDGFSHKMVGDDLVTTVHYQNYTEEIPDPDQVLFGYLTRRFRPVPSDESC
jgi:hypothetical protein